MNENNKLKLSELMPKLDSMIELIQENNKNQKLIISLLKERSVNNIINQPVNATKSAPVPQQTVTQPTAPPMDPQIATSYPAMVSSSKKHNPGDITGLDQPDWVDGSDEFA